MTTSGPDDFSTAEVLGEEPPRRRYPRSLVLAGVTAAVLVAGAGVATAAALSPSPSPSPTATAGDGASPSPSGTPSDGKGWGRGHRAGLGGPALHGEYVVRGEDGGYVTIATQYGDVTAADQDSVTVKSEDGYTKEYALTSETRINRGGDGADAIKTGQKVMVAAKVDAGTATAVVVRDVTDRAGTAREHGKGWGKGWGGKGYGGGGDGGAGHGRWHHEPPASSPAPSPPESPAAS
ncbi:hypothetical protein SMD20_07005 [Nonomuraea sp. LP-02]|uniref:hypothetical protein n=1 Tax=Nonomuraea sp. LP-02 TaxID=3097960 RepID=UPI002E3506B5|nr:hypothetical protein [Nonomuraea sp. LP-02]MED7923971.1 hypothetical protein [Nonomuraea sp. LP-02]